MSSRWDHIIAGHVFKFKGGIHPAEHKTTNTIASSVLTFKNDLIIPIKQHSGVAGEVCVSVGQKVLQGEALTKATSRMQVPVHAPVAGTVTAIGMAQIAHPSGLDAECITLTPLSDEEASTLTPYQHPKYPNFTNIDPVVLLDHIREMGIAGLGGAGFPTDVKLRSNVNTATPCELLIINGAECEPYITCDDRMMVEKATSILTGIKILQQVLNPRFTVIAVETNKPEAIAKLNEAIIATKAEKVRVTELPVKYPSGAARNLIKLITDIEVPYGARSSAYGVIVQNIGTIYAIEQAVLYGTPLTHRLVTVCGDAISKPGNYWINFGTQIADILDACGYQAPENPRIILGGPMMGFTLPSVHVPLIKTGNCIIAPSATELKRTKPQVDCISCGKCARVCPSRLLPYELHAMCVIGDHARAQKCGIHSCIECGCCSFVCPSAIRLVESFRQEKARLKAQKRLDKRLAVAKERFAAKKIRLEQEEKLRAERKAQALAKAKAMQATKTKAATNDNTSNVKPPVAKTVATTEKKTTPKAVNIASPVDSAKVPTADNTKVATDKVITNPQTNASDSSQHDGDKQ